RSYADVKYRCSLFPSPVVSGSFVNWMAQMTSLFPSFVMSKRSLYCASSPKRELATTASNCFSARAKSGEAPTGFVPSPPARVMYTSPRRYCAAGLSARPNFAALFGHAAKGSLQLWLVGATELRRVVRHRSDGVLAVLDDRGVDVRDRLTVRLRDDTRRRHERK